MPNLTTSYSGLYLKNPIIAASSGLTSGLSNLIELEKQGIAAVVLKSLFEEEIIAEMKSRMQDMNMQGFIYPETVEFYEDHLPEGEESTIKYLELIRAAKKHLQIPVIASINCVTANQWTYFPKEIQNAGADALELNLFILPTDATRSGKNNEEVYFSIIEEVLKVVTIPVTVKMSFYFSNLMEMITRISQTGVKGLVLFNRYYSPDIDIENLKITNGNVLSNAGDLAMILRWIAIMSGRVSCDLAATTGIHDGKDLVKVLLAGADVAQVASTFYSNGFGHIEHMLRDLEQWMISKSFNSISDFKGLLSQANVSNPASYERVQFMKYFRGYKNNSVY